MTDWTQWQDTGEASSSGDETPTDLPPNNRDNRDGGADWTSAQRASQPAPRQEHTGTTRSRASATKLSRNTLTTGAAAVALVAVVGGGAAYLVSAVSDESAAAETASAPEQSPAPSAVAETEAAAVTVAGDCDVEAGEQKIVGGDTTLQGVTAQFQQQYFDGAAGEMDALLTKSSSMHGQDWESVLDSVEGAQYCLTMQPAQGDVVRASLEVTAEGDATTYEQVVQGVQADDGTWKIQEMRGAE